MVSFFPRWCHTALPKHLFFLLPFTCVSCRGLDKKKRVSGVLSSTKILFFFVRKRRAFGVSTLGFHFFLFFSPPFFLKIFKEKGPHHTKKDFFSLRKFRGIQHKNRSLRGVRESPRTKSNTHSSYGGARAESRRRAKFVELYAVTGCVCCCCCCFCSLLLLFPFLKGDENRILDLKTRGCSIF